MKSLEKYLDIKFKPLADRKSIVTAGNARFTVLTDRIIRMEYSSLKKFEDRASQVFWYREQPVPDFKVVENEKSIEIITDCLQLVYIIDGNGFTAENISIKLLDSGNEWRYGDRDRENLFGTIRTLDDVNGRTRLEKGLVSRSGWSVIDDSTSLVFNENSWLVNRDDEEALDIYFFGYCNEYLKCIQDFCKISGEVPMIPRWSLGNWWSRYWEYSDNDLMNLMNDFKDKEIPLSVCIIDMDWHIVENKYTWGWTGYTWNKKLFPESEKFLSWLHEKGLKTALNLHPSSGIHPHEEKYKEMAEFMGIDPASEKPVEFDITNPKFVKGYFDILHHPLEEQGVDFWWMDWQQGKKSKIKNLDPLWLLNHLHFYDIGRDEGKRQFSFSRFSGIGSQRYPIGFSGDTIVTWKSLEFQPYLTATASNVAYGWWSHDIGGHMEGTEDGELFARWVQFGVFSPIMRIHSTKNPFIDRRPWVFDEEKYAALKMYMNLRHALIPYIYTMAWKNHIEGIPLITPMYYSWPNCDEAYVFLNQYYFGSEMIAAPYTSPIDKETNYTRKSVWLPDGDWFDFFTGEYHKGGSVIAKYGKLKDMPVFAKAGAIIPMDLKPEFGRVGNPENIVINVFPGRDNEFSLYEDDGNTQEYIKGKYSKVKFVEKWEECKLDFYISKAEGEIKHLPKKRNYCIRFRSIHMPDGINIKLNGETIDCKWEYSKNNKELVIKDVCITPYDELSICLNTNSGKLMNKEINLIDKCFDILMNFNIENDVKHMIYINIEKIIDNTNLLYKYSTELKHSQIRAIIETIKGIDMDYSTK